MLKARWLAVPALLLAGFVPVAWQQLHPGARSRSRSGGGDLQLAAPVLPARAGAVQDTVDSSRRTAIVRAAERVAPAVVSVNVVRRESVQPRTVWESFFMPPGTSREVAGLGSGFIIDPRGFVLTNEHVVRGATEVVVTLRDGRDLPAQLVGTDEVTDLALLRLQDAPENLPAAPLGSSSNLVIGEWAVAIGNPFGFLLANAEPTVTAGVISGVNRNIIPSDETSQGAGYYLDMIQTDASINPGNSGGPLVNVLGQVIGVNSSIISGSGGSIGLGFAIPIDRARRVAEDLQRSGSVRRVWAGLQVEPYQPNRWGRSQSIAISSVAPGSPAAQAGLRAGQLIREVNGRATHSPLDWEARLLDTRAGEPLELVILDGARPRSVRVNTQGLPSLSAARVNALDEFQLVTLTPAIRAERELRSEQGALIVRASEAAQQIGLREGDLIVQINRTPVRNAEDAAQLLARLARAQLQVRMVVERQGTIMSASFYIRG
ncbi:MAG: PDZ domain-containing protein [Gemmatimonadetes bacterium]|nr:PDZ domain-containing protein [Gemmatimonadota bacterium]